MIAAGHQPNYLPYLGFFHKITRCDIFVLVDTVQFVKRGAFGWMNRNRIRTADGRPPRHSLSFGTAQDGWLWLTVPVLTSGKYHQTIIETQIDNARSWRRKHWTSIQRAYQKAPYFNQYKNFFEDIYQREWQNLVDLNEVIIRYLIEQFNIRVQIAKTSLLNVSGQKADLIINICKKVGADTYVHGRHGRDYIDASKFTGHNIKCLWQEFKHPEYKQLYEPFIPELSAIDLLFNCGPASGEIIRKAGNFT